MPVNLLSKQVPTTYLLPLKNADGSPMLDDDNEPAAVRIHTPASKVYEVAHAAMRRKTMKRVRESGGRIEAAADDIEDKQAFLVAITEEFVNVSLPEVGPGAKTLVRAVYENPQLGFIRDQIEGAASDWGSFPDSSATG